MSKEYRHFPDIFKEVIDNVRLTIDPIVGETGGVFPIFKCGSYAELVSSSLIDDNNQNIKYPLVWLVWDAGEDNEHWIVGDIYELNPRVFLLTRCELDNSSEYCRETYIKPTLIPILDEILDEMFCHPNIEAFIDFPKRINEHPHWGENYQNKMFDTLTGIEVNFEKLIIKEH